jgi:hypothetical protein
MNDFTKEELLVIHGYITEINRRYYATEEMESIEIKVKSLIDNYCEHKNKQGA